VGPVFGTGIDDERETNTSIKITNLENLVNQKNSKYLIKIRNLKSKNISTNTKNQNLSFDQSLIEFNESKTHSNELNQLGPTLIGDPSVQHTHSHPPFRPSLGSPSPAVKQTWKFHSNG